MLPYIRIFSREVPLYSIMVLLGAAAALVYMRTAKRRAPELEADTELALVYAIIGVFIGAKLLSVFTVLPQMLDDIGLLTAEPQRFLERYLYSGFVFYGGLYGAAAAVWLYCLFSRIRFFTVAEILLPMLPLVHAFGRIGCFCMGCCYGKPTESFGIVLSRSVIAPNDIPLIPVQLFEATVELAIFCLLAQAARKGADGRRLMAFYLISYGAARFFLEFLRGDFYRGFIGPLSLSQIISIGTVVFGAILLNTTSDEKQQSI